MKVIGITNRVAKGPVKKKDEDGNYITVTEDNRSLILTAWFDENLTSLPTMRVRYDGEDDDGNPISMTQTLTNIHKTEADACEGTLVMSDFLKGVWDKDFDLLNSLTMTVIVDTDGSTPPQEVEVENPATDPEFQDGSLGSTIFRKWNLANQTPSTWARRAESYTNNIIPDTTNLTEFFLEAHNDILLLDWQEPTILTAEAFQQIVDGGLNQESNNGKCYLVEQPNKTYKLVIFYSNACRNYTEEWDAQEVYTVGKEFYWWDAKGINVIDSARIKRIPNVVAHRDYVDYAPLKITSAYDSDNPFNNEIETALQGLQPQASEIKLDDYQLSRLPNSKHVKANLGYTTTGITL